MFYICLFLAVVVFALYWPVRNHDFVRYDDDKYVTHNRNIQSGINSRSIRWAFTKYHASNWHPVTWISHMLDYRIFGLNAGAHHLVNVFFHIVNTLLLFIVFNRMTKALWASAFIAAVFGLHPLHVESVAWVAERKDVLSTFFWMFTMLAYVCYTEKSNIARYLLTLMFFIIGLMAKPMLVTLPFVLLLLDYWPLERMRFYMIIKAGKQQDDIQKSFHYLVLEKVPFFVFSLLSSIVTFLVQRCSGAVQTIDSVDIKSRIGNAVVSYIGYISRMFWPGKLAVLYPYPENGFSISKVIICGLFLAGIITAVILLSRRHKYLVTGWFWYIVTLVPVIGFIQVGVQAMADRYTYIPMTGLLIMIVWGIYDFFGTWKYRKKVLTVISILLVSAMFAKTSMQLKYWQNSASLFKHTLDVTSNNYVMHNNYAAFLDEQDKAREAIEQLNKSLAIKPNAAETYINLGNALSSIGKINEAITQYRKSIKLKAGSSDAHYNLALALARQGRTDEAISEYYEAVRFDSKNVDALSNLGFELAQKGNYDEAIEFYRKALAVMPENIITHGRLGLALAAQGKNDEAIKEFRFVLAARPDDAEMWCNLGILLERQNKITEAIEQYRHALQFEPDNENAKALLDVALKKAQAQP